MAVTTLNPLRWSIVGRRGSGPRRPVPTPDAAPTAPARGSREGADEWSAHVLEARRRAAEQLSEQGLTLVAVTEDDWRAMVGLVAELGDEGRSSRFHGSIGQLGEERARRLAAASPGTRVGCAALTPDGRFAAHAMVCASDGDGPEFAVMTSSQWQGRGLATSLARVLAAESLADGQPFWSAEIRGDNAAAFALCARLGRVEHRHWDGGSVHVHLHLAAV